MSGGEIFRNQLFFLSTCCSALVCFSFFLLGPYDDMDVVSVFREKFGEEDEEGLGHF